MNKKGSLHTYQRRGSCPDFPGHCRPFSWQTLAGEATTDWPTWRGDGNCHFGPGDGERKEEEEEEIVGVYWSSSWLTELVVAAELNCSQLMAVKCCCCWQKKRWWVVFFEEEEP